MNLTRKYLVRMGEEMLVSGALAAGAYAVSGGSLTRDVLVGALVAAGRAMYGVLVKGLGSKDKPSAA